MYLSRDFLPSPTPFLFFLLLFLSRNGNKTLGWVEASQRKIQTPLLCNSFSTWCSRLLAENRVTLRLVTHLKNSLLHFLKKSWEKRVGLSTKGMLNLPWESREKGIFYHCLKWEYKQILSTTFTHPSRRAWKKELVTQPYLTLCNPLDCSLPGSSVHGIIQASIWVGWHVPLQGNLPNPGIEPRSPAL